jgi:cellulose biosynthesis protein BcsQ
MISRKGGSGKSTLAIHLAVAAQQAGLAVGLIDLDPQQSAAEWGDERRACRKGERIPAYGSLTIPAQPAAFALEPAHDPVRHRRQAQATG